MSISRHSEGNEELMSYFQKTLAQRIVLSLLLVVTTASPFARLIEPQDSAQRPTAIGLPHSSADLSATVQKHEIRYGFNAAIFSVVPIFINMIPEDYVPGTPFDPLSIDLLTNPNRGPPRRIAAL